MYQRAINNTGNDDGAMCTMNNPCEVDFNGKTTSTSGSTATSAQSTPPMHPPYILVTPGFESGADAGWTGTAGPVTNNADRPARTARTGTWKLWLGGNGRTATETIDQTVTVPANGKLRWLRHHPGHLHFLRGQLPTDQLGHRRHLTHQLTNQHQAHQP